MSYYATGVSIVCSTSPAQPFNHGYINKYISIEQQIFDSQSVVPGVPTSVSAPHTYHVTQ